MRIARCVPIVSLLAACSKPTPPVTTTSAYGIVGYSWRSSFFGTFDDSQYAVVKSYGLLNLRAGLKGEVNHLRWDASVWMNNATDRRYFVGGLTGATFEAYSLFPGDPRFWGATVRLEF